MKNEFPVLLIELLRYQCSLSSTEAIACIKAYRSGQLWSSEAVNHYGGTKKCIDDAIQARKRLYKIYNGPLETYWTLFSKGL